MVCEETFHQKLIVPGPRIVVCTEAEPLCGTSWMRAESAPSCATAIWPTHAGEPLVAQTKFVVSSASASGTSVLTVSAAFMLFAVPTALPTTTE